IGKSSCCSLASSAANKSNTSFTTAKGRASGRSTLLITTIGLSPTLSAFDTTNLVCGSGPSAASTNTSAPSTILRIRSTSPPKSAWPGVSTMLMRVWCQRIDVALAKMVMPRSRSRSLESSARSARRWLSRTAPDCCSRRSTSVVLPWSTWAMMATLRSFMALLLVGQSREARFRRKTGTRFFRIALKKPGIREAQRAEKGSPAKATGHTLLVAAQYSQESRENNALFAIWLADFRPLTWPASGAMALFGGINSAKHFLEVVFDGFVTQAGANPQRVAVAHQDRTATGLQHAFRLEGLDDAAGIASADPE